MRNTVEPSMESIADTLGQIGDAFADFKTKQAEEIRQIRNHAERLETKICRPGAFTSGDSSAGEVRMLRTAAGEPLPFLKSTQKLADIRDRSNDDFDLGTFCRNALLGSRESKTASGPALVPVSVGSQIIDRVRVKTVIVEAGAGTIIIGGPTNLARLTGDGTVYQHSEAATDISESDITASAVSLSPKLLACLVPLSVELVSDSPNLDQLLQTSLASAFAAKIDALAIATLLADANIPKSAVAQDPAIWLKTLEAVGSALAVNQDVPFAHVGAPGDFIARASQLASTAGSWLGKPPALAAMRELFSTSMTAGTALFGDFAAGFAIALREELRLEIVRHAKPTSGSHLLVAHMRADGVVLQAAKLFKQLKTP
jgi:HK97 family phage major capsid protein